MTRVVATYIRYFGQLIREAHKFSRETWGGWMQWAAELLALLALLNATEVLPWMRQFLDGKPAAWVQVAALTILVLVFVVGISRVAYRRETGLINELNAQSAAATAALDLKPRIAVKPAQRYKDFVLAVENIGRVSAEFYGNIRVLRFAETDAENNTPTALCWENFEPRLAITSGGASFLRVGLIGLKEMLGPNHWELGVFRHDWRLGCSPVAPAEQEPTPLESQYYIVEVTIGSEPMMAEEWRQVYRLDHKGLHPTTL